MTNNRPTTRRPVNNSRRPAPTPVRRRRQRINPEILKGLAILIGFVLFFVVVCSTIGAPKTTYKEGLDGEIHKISFIEVNLREEPSTSSDILSQLHTGDKVTLTGNVHDALFSDDSWHEVVTPNGKTGWVVTRSISWR